MLKLTKTGIGLLTKQYRSVLRKCWAINVGIFATTALLTSLASNEAKADGHLYDSVTDGRTVTGYSINSGGAGYVIAADIDKMYANFVNNTSGHVGGALYMSKDISHVIGNYWGNAAASVGGAIYGGSRSIETINANFIENTASSGGAIVSLNSIGTLNGSFVNNRATDGQGGAISTGANITNLTADFINNSATSYGGGMAISGTITNLNSDFKGNTAGISGGGIYSSGAITTLSADFIGNSSTSHGGGIYNEGTITSLSGTFRDNVSNYGGAVFNRVKTIGTITGDFKENIASSSTSNVWGGGIGNSGGTITSITGDFINNSAVSTAAGANGSAIGGAVYNSEGTITSITGDFKGNKVEALSGSGNYGHEGSHGGAIANYVYGTSGTSHIGTIKGNFEDNTVTGAVWETGGAISNYAERSDSSTSGTILLQIDLIEGNFKNNSVVTTTNFTGVMGGAISNFAVGNNTSTIITKIKGNFEGNSTVNGGAIYNRSDDGTATISSIVGDFINNTASRDGGALVNYGTGATINSITGNFISNTATRKGGAIYNSGSVGLKADTQDILFYNNTSGTGENITYNDIYNQGTVNLNASGDHKISFGGSIDGASGTVNINTDNLQGGTYVFNNKVQNQSINIGSSTATNATTVRMGKITQTDGSESTGQLDNITSLTNYAVNSVFDTQNNTIEAQNITTLYLSNAMKLYIDAKLSGSGNTADTINATNVYSGSSGTEAPVAGSLIIDKINLIDTAYDDSGKTAEIVVAEEDSDLAQAYTVSDNVLKNNNMNYYTKVDYDNGKIIFSDKLINESGFYENLGSWSDGHYILNSTSVSNSADASHLTVGQALSALDEQLYNYYYTFRVDERVEVIEFTKELRSNKKEMSSLDFMPIKSSSDLRINLIKAEDPLTFSAKTRDDSLVLMEVRHA